MIGHFAITCDMDCDARARVIRDKYLARQFIIMADSFDKVVEGFAGAITVGVLLLALGAIIDVQMITIDSKVIGCLLLSIVPILTFVSMVQDVNNLKAGKIALFVGSLIGTIFCWIYL